MWTCRKCGAAVDDGFEVCWGCGASEDGAVDPAFVPEVEGIIRAEDLPPELSAADFIDWASLTCYSTPVEANAIRQCLEEAAIPVFLAQENTTSTLALNNLVAIRVQVPQEELARAQEVLAAAIEAGELPHL